MIECNPAINFGMPALKGRRLTVYDIVTKLYFEESIAVAIDDYSITIEDAKDAIAYCRSLKCKEDKDLIQFCDGCLLRTMADGWTFNKENYVQLEENGQKITVFKDGKVYFIGSIQEFEEDEFGKTTWLIAEEVERMLI